MRNKIGIMGGTFNPIHNGHIALALTAYSQFSLDKVWVMISPSPPHKSESPLLDIKKRAELVKLAVADYTDELEYSDFELKRSGYIYTADTLTLLRSEYPQNEYYFIMGGDSIRDIEKWYKPETVFENAVILAAARDDMDDRLLKEQIAHLEEKYNSDVRILKTGRIDISSTRIRENIAADIPITGMVPCSVEKHIIEKMYYKTNLGLNEEI